MKFITVEKAAAVDGLDPVGVLTALYPAARVDSDGGTGYKVRLPDTRHVAVDGRAWCIEWKRGSGGVGAVSLIMKLQDVEREDAIAILRPLTCVGVVPPTPVRRIRGTSIVPVTMPSADEGLRVAVTKYLTETRRLDSRLVLKLFAAGFFIPGTLTNLTGTCRAAMRAAKSAGAEAPTPTPSDFVRTAAVITPLVAYDDMLLPRPERRILGTSARAICAVEEGSPNKKNRFPDGALNGKDLAGAVLGGGPGLKTLVFTESPIEAASYFQFRAPPPGEVAVIGVCGSGSPDAALALAKRCNLSVISAYNNDDAGRSFEAATREVCERDGIIHMADFPAAKDWNDSLPPRTVRTMRT
jgi:hypothetical protein